MKVKKQDNSIMNRKMKIKGEVLVKVSCLLYDMKRTGMSMDLMDKTCLLKFKGNLWKKRKWETNF